MDVDDLMIFEKSAQVAHEWQLCNILNPSQESIPSAIKYDFYYKPSK